MQGGRGRMGVMGGGKGSCSMALKFVLLGCVSRWEAQLEQVRLGF